LNVCEQGDIEMLKVLFAANTVANFMLLNCHIFQLPVTSSIYSSAQISKLS